MLSLYLSFSLGLPGGAQWRQVIFSHKPVVKCCVRRIGCCLGPAMLEATCATSVGLDQGMKVSTVKLKDVQKP